MIYADMQQVAAIKPQCVIDLEAKILTEDSAMTTSERDARFARLEAESEKHGAFARIWA